MPAALRPGERWSLGFVSDTFGASRKFHMLAVNDDCCRENLCLMADTSISGARVARELDPQVLTPDRCPVGCNNATKGLGQVAKRTNTYE